MNNRLQELIEAIKKLEKELAEELDRKQEEFFYRIRDGRIRFDREVKRRHQALVTNIGRYLFTAETRNILTAPLIWFCLIPALFLDLVVTVFQAVCFRVYKIPRVPRHRFIVIDRTALSYLNGIEKMNCAYCGYFNGLIAYVQEVAARTEQYWCPIKHAKPQGSYHSRYKNFLEYGDALGYKEKLESIRRDFSDLE